MQQRAKRTAADKLSMRPIRTGEVVEREWFIFSDLLVS
jgi:hypothetical protein